ncbi:MAG: hypothetical protein COB53_12085 [Elusimicrobia bacterium]|nr:MAG: hypothetical protein COB53_12085 [Elusimicrobiota bacterium]
MTAAVQMVLVPPLLAFFGKISIAGFLVNLISVPLSAIVTGMGFLGWATGLPLGLETVIQGFCALCRFASSGRWSVWEIPPFPLSGWLCYYGILFSGIMLPPKRAVLASLAVGGTALLTTVQRPPETPLHLQFTSWGVIVGAGGKDVYCVRTASSGEGLLRCPMRRTFSTRQEGPIRVNIYGSSIQIKSARTGDTLGGSVPQQG